MSIILIDYGQPSIDQLIDIIKKFSDNIIILKSTDSPILPSDLLCIVLSGGPDRINDPSHLELPEWIFHLSVPVIGICYGCQLIAKYFGGNIEATTILPKRISEIRWYDEILIKNPVYFNHYDHITKVPLNLDILATDENGIIAAITDRRRYWGFQFHPELSLDRYNFFDKLFKLIKVNVFKFDQTT